jgi:hypothetical protein
MCVRIPALLVAVVALSTSSIARADSSFNLEGYIGWQKLDVGDGSASGITDSNAILGGAAVAKVGWFGIGAQLDKGLDSQIGLWSGAGLLGLMFDFSESFRLEALGMVGRSAKEFGDMFSSPGFTFYGVRPGFSFRVTGPLRVGAAVPIRWRQNANNDFGSAEYSFVGRVGLEF